MAPRPSSGTLGDLLDEIAAETPHAEAIVSRGERVDYLELKVRAEAFAKALIASGIARGDRVAVLVTNRTEWLVAAFGAAKIGAIVAAISTFSTSRELNWALDHSGAAALVALSKFRGRDFLGTARPRGAARIAHRRGDRRRSAGGRAVAVAIPGARCPDR